MDWEAFYNRFREPNFVPGYEIQNRLGGGAFGEVYKARKHSIGKAYAIKFLKIDDDAQRDAVERELETVRHFAVIDHPNLVTIEDLGSVMGVPYLIMGYAGEDTLARRLKQGELDPREALSYFVQTCRGVLALHDRRLVHFDLKPSNVFLKGDVARVGDYGLSKMMADGHSTLSFGRGTPHYMAPEMLRNRADHRADVYSLGVILFESLARQLPYPTSVPGTISVRENDDPPLFPPEFPAAARRVVERCLRLAPADRYADVGELLADLGQTARPGDSVRAVALDGFGPGTVRAGPVSRGPAASSNATSATPATRGAHGASDARPSDTRVAARELTRGAVEVARGMWDGIVVGPAQRARGDASDAGDRRVHDGGDVFALQTLSSSGGEPTPFGGPDPTPHLAAAASTIPVPPPVQGGWRGTLFSTLALALEVLLAMFRALAGFVVRIVWHGRRADVRPEEAPRGFLSRVRAAVARVVRFGLFVAILVLLGGLATLLVFKLLGGDLRTT